MIWGGPLDLDALQAGRLIPQPSGPTRGKQHDPGEDDTIAFNYRVALRPHAGVVVAVDGLSGLLKTLPTRVE